MVEQSFHSVPLGDEDLKHDILKPGDLVYWKRYLQKNSLQPHWRGPYQVLLTSPWVVKLQGIDPWIHVTHLKEALNPDWTCTLSGVLKVKSS